jgi:hypothetical protein
MPITNNNSNPTVVVNEQVNKIVVNTPGPQGPRGQGILNGSGAPASNLGFQNDFYYDITTTSLYGPKLSDATWAGATIIRLDPPISFQSSWEVGQLSGPTNGLYSIAITHNLGFSPNITVKASSGDVLETGIDYNSINQITLTMAQPFSGTAFLS